MPRFPIVLAAVALGAALALPVGIAGQAGPVEVYRAYWDSGLIPTDPGAERFRSQAMLREFRALLEEEPGVYVGDVSWGNVQVAVVEAFGGGGIRMELWEIPEEEFPGGGLDAARARELGILRARVVSDGVVVVPSLAVVGL